MLWQPILGIMAISSFPLLSKAHTQYWVGGVHFLYGSRTAGAHHTFTSPYPMPFTCIPLLCIPSITFFPPPSSLLTRKSQVSTVISALNLKLRLSLNHSLSNEANLSHFKVTANTPESIPSTLFPWIFQYSISAFQYLAINRYDVKTWSSLQGTAVKFRGTTVRWNPEQSGAEELSLRSQGLIRLLQPNLAPLMNKLRWFSPHLSHLCFAGTSGTPAQ